MDKEPKKPGGENDTERDDIQEIRVNSIPLMVLIAGVLSSVDFVDWMFTIAEMLVVFVLTYQILGVCSLLPWQLRPFWLCLSVSVWRHTMRSCMATMIWAAMVKMTAMTTLTTIGII